MKGYDCRDNLVYEVAKRDDPKLVKGDKIIQFGDKGDESGIEGGNYFPLQFRMFHYLQQIISNNFEIDQIEFNGESI